MAVIEFSRNKKPLFASDNILLYNYKKLAQSFRKLVFQYVEHTWSCQNCIASMLKALW